MEDKVISKMDESISKIIEEGVTTNNLDNLYKLSKIKHYYIMEEIIMAMIIRIETMAEMIMGQEEEI